MGSINLFAPFPWDIVVQEIAINIHSVQPRNLSIQIKVPMNFLAKFPHSPILHYACRSLLTENKGKNNAIAMGPCAVFVVSWWRNKGLHTLNRMHNEVWGCAEI